ncbi:hypothetical protein QR680_004649 [Steinernema hermaphroditum]|uniref:F-box domain-containing protein n=1 Tax=Steinernema hermaphroditum TaxID=289476 RepID=A0AA39LU15_9BILA|nr:hypothetical protein QR680_004649 [Steinernema hermaphroditum]
MDHFEQMPPEVVFRILRQFDRKEAFKLRPVCRQWNSLITSNSKVFPKIRCRTLDISKRSSISIDGRLVYTEPKSRKRKYRQNCSVAEPLRCPSPQFFEFLSQCLHNYRIDTLSFTELSFDDVFLSHFTQTLQDHPLETVEFAFIEMGGVHPTEFYNFVAGLRVQRLTLNWLRNVHHQLLNGDFFKNVLARINCLQIGHICYVNAENAFTIEEDVVEEVLRTANFEIDVTVDKDNVNLMYIFFKV